MYVEVGITLISYDLHLVSVMLNILQSTFIVISTSHIAQQTNKLRLPVKLFISG